MHAVIHTEVQFWEKYERKYLSKCRFHRQLTLQKFIISKIPARKSNLEYVGTEYQVITGEV